MKENNELERIDIEVDRHIQVDDDNPQQINAYLELWCNVKKKFHTELGENSLLDMYAFYNPFEDTLKLECIIDNGETKGEDFEYEPNEDEAKLIKEMITEKIRDDYGQTPQEFCLSVTEDMGMGGIT